MGFPTDSLKEREKKSDIKITFTVAGSDEEDTSSTDSTVDVENPPENDRIRDNNISNNRRSGNVNYGADIDVSKE